MIEGGRPPAKRQGEYRAALRRSFLSRYDRDEEVAAALLDLIPAAEAAGVGRLYSTVRTYAEIENALLTRPSTTSRPPTGSVEAEFVRVLNDFATSFGLDRLGDAGRAQIVAWCSRYLRARRSGSLAPVTYGPGRFSTASLAPSVELDPVGIIGPPWREEYWELTRERRVDVRRRLEARARAHIQSTLDLIEADAIAKGLVFPDTTPRLERDLDWLYQKVRFGNSFQTIYNSLKDPPEGGVDTVRRTVLRIADKVGLNKSGWESGWR